MAKSYKIMCDQTGEIFPSIKKAQEDLHILGIRNYLIGEYSYAGKLPDGTKLTWTKVNN